MTYPVLLPKFFPILSDGNGHANVFSPLSLFYRRTYALRKFVVERVNILAENLGASRKENDDDDDDGHRVRSDTRSENAKSLALDIPLGEIISRATRGNKKGQRARMEVRKDERRRETERERDARKFLYGDYGAGGALLHLLFPQVARAHYSWGSFLSLSFSHPLCLSISVALVSLTLFLSLSLPHPLFLFSARCQRRGESARMCSNERRGFHRRRKGRKGGGRGWRWAWAAAGTVIEYPRI